MENFKTKLGRFFRKEKKKDPLLKEMIHALISNHQHIMGICPQLMQFDAYATPVKNQLKLLNLLDEVMNYEHKLY